MKIRSIEYLVLLILLISLSVAGETTDIREPLYRESLRPQFHFTARYWDQYRLNPPNHEEGWINDLNGLMYNDGVYHLFAQRWWSAWLHAVSTDLIHWKELKPAFGKGGQFGGTQSGGGVVDRNNTSGLGDGITAPMIAFWSSTDNLNQCMSYSLDNGQTWRKYEKNPVLVHKYRDPNVFWYEPDKKWILILYGPSDDVQRETTDGFNGESNEPKNVYLLFSSPNLLDWTKLDTEISDSFECPDMFPLPVDGNADDVKWVVIDGNGDYRLGSFDGKKYVQEIPKQKGDYGRNFYATMTFDDMPSSDPRRIQLAWMRGWDEYPKNMPFNQQISFPCELTLHRLPEGIVLRRYPVQEISTIYDKTVGLENLSLQPTDNPLASLQGELFDVEAMIDVQHSRCSRIEFNLCGNTVSYDLSERILESVGSKVLLAPRDGKIEIRILIDRLSLETFGNRGEVSITNIAYQKNTAPRLSIRALNGEASVMSLTAHTLKSIWE